jgi:signal transduction histidine kinase
MMSDQNVIRAAYYLRISTEAQELDDQRGEIMPFIERRGWKLVHPFEDVMSGRKSEKDRPGFAAMLKAAHQRKFDIVVFWASDRLIISLTSGGQVNGRLTFRFTEERDFHPEELEIARALATQASLAIQLTRLAKTARQSAVLEERNQLAGEIHDSLAQFFTGISMQLSAAKEVIKAGDNNGLSYVERASDLAQFGLAEARRSAFSLRLTIIEESGLIEALQKLVERSNVAGRLRCDFRSDRIPDENLVATVQHQLLRIAQEAISNAVRHAKPTVVTVTLRWDPPNLILQVKDNGSGIPKALVEKSEGVGKLEIQTAAGHGTSIIVTVPIS